MTSDKRSPDQRYPIESFDPRMIDLMVKGTKERVEVGPMPWRKAFRLQSRMQSLRGRMRNANHPLANLVTKVKLSLFWGERAGLAAIGPASRRGHTLVPPDRDTPTILVVELKDAEFDDVFAAIGMEPVKVAATVEEAEALASSSSADLDDFLAQVVKK